MNCRPEDMLVYAVTDRAWLKGESLKDQVEKALKGGVTFVQLREKNLDRRLFLEEAAAIKELCDSFHVPFVINDDVEIALASGADGVHVGQKDMDVKEARRRLGPGKIIGVSCKTVEQAKAAEAGGADYLGVGAMYPTDTKSDTSQVTVETLKAICRAAEIISREYGCAVLCKGGHRLNDANDLLYRDGGFCWFMGRRIDNPNTHGTGCTLSSAIASGLARGYSLEQAVERAKEYLSGALEAMLDLGSGSGPMDHGFQIP